MTPLTTRSDLTAMAARHAPTNACATAMKENRAVVLGGFASPGTLPKWIVTVRSRHGREWFIAICCDEKNLKYSVEYPEVVPWEDWIGKASGRRPLIDGDDPVSYALKRVNARRKRCRLNA